MFHTKKIINRMMSLSLLASLGFAALLSLAQTDAALAATAPDLGMAGTFGILSNVYTNTAIGTTINGDLGYTTGPAVAPTVNGITHVVDATYNQAGLDQATALGILNGQPCTLLPPGVALDAVDIGGGPGVFTPGCYFRAGALDITATTTVTLNGAGVYIFRSTGGALTTGANSSVVLAGGVCENDVFWAPVGATTLGANTAFVGNILDAAGIAIGLSANLEGRALAFGGTVSTDANTITVPTCVAFGTTPPTLSKAFNPPTIDMGGVSTLTITLYNPNPIAAYLTAVLTDTLPGGVVIAPIPNAGTTCGAGVVTVGLDWVTLTGGSIPGGVPGGTCTVTVDVTAAAAGNYTNTLDFRVLQTTNASNAAQASAALPVGPLGPPGATVIPTLNEWGMIIFMVLVGLMSIYYLRRQKAKA